MSQGYPPPQPPATVAYMTPGGVLPPSNALGVAGFVLVMVGLLGACFVPFLLLGLIGTILCAVAVFRTPRGLAIAGLIVGGLEVLFGLVVLVFIGTILGGAAVGLNAAAKIMQTMQTGVAIRQVIDAEQSRTGTLPATLASVPGLTTTTDAWGRPIHYVPNSPTVGEYELISDGPDSTPGTADDIRMDRNISVAATSQPTTAP